MNILITGNSGFLAKEFNLSLCKENSLFKIKRDDLLNIDLIVKNLIDNKIEYIVHTSWAGVGSGTLEDYEYNLKVHTILEAVSELVKGVFIFGSGVELSENSNYYSTAKRIISKRVTKLPKFTNLRLFGCFGKCENDHRFIRRSMLNILLGEDIVINKDKSMDFFYVGDLVSLIQHYINHPGCNLPNDLNCVYKDKYKLSDIARFLTEKYSKNTQVKILEPVYDDPYIASSESIDNLHLHFKGLHQGIQEIYGH